MALVEYSIYENNLRLFIECVFPSSVPIFGKKHWEMIDAYDKFNKSDDLIFALGILGSKGCCKTHLESLMIIHTILTRDNINIFIISGKIAQAHATVFKEVRYLIGKSELFDILEVTQRDIKYKNKEYNEKFCSKGVLFTYNDGVNKDKLSAGLHGDYNMFILDEANNLDEGLFSQFKGTLASGRLCIIASANPEDDIDPKVPFSYFSQIMEDTTNSISGIEWLRYYINIHDANFPAANKQAMMQAYIEGTVEYDKFVLGKNVRKKTDTLLFPYTDVQQCIYVIKELPVDRFASSYGVFGVDIAAGTGRHYTVIAYRSLLSVYIEVHSQHMSVPMLKDEIVKYSSLSGNKPFYIDENGPGMQLYQMLQHHSRIKIYPAKASSRVVDDKTLYNRQIQLYTFLSKLIKLKLISIFIPEKCFGATNALLRECTYIITDYKKHSKENCTGAEFVLSKSRNSHVSPDIIDAISNTFGAMNVDEYNKFLNAAITHSGKV